VRLVRAFAVVALAACASTARAECVAPRLSDQHINTIAKDIAAASRQLDSSSVILRLSFSDPARPPAIETIYAGGDKRFAKQVIEDSGQLRSDCASLDVPVSTVQMARLSASSRLFGRYEPRLDRELKLVDVLKIVKDSKRQQKQIDTTVMGCPFKLVFSPFQPYLPNRVLDPKHDFRRLQLVQWLESITLNIPGDAMPTAIGQESLITVPCAVLDLS
jgi:hypothetical protein